MPNLRCADASELHRRVKGLTTLMEITALVRTPWAEGSSVEAGGAAPASVPLPSKCTRQTSETSFQTKWPSDPDPRLSSIADEQRRQEPAREVDRGVDVEEDDEIDVADEHAGQQ